MLSSSQATRLIVAHRLDTIEDSDIVIVMDGGNVREYGHPSDLANDPTSAYAALLRAHCAM